MSALTASERRLVLQLLRQNGRSGSRAARAQLVLPSSSSSSPTSNLRSLHSSARRSEGEDASPAQRAQPMPDLATLTSGASGFVPRPKPPMATYYTARPTYIATLLRLADLTRRSKRALELAHVLPPGAHPPTAEEAAASASAAGATARRGGAGARNPWLGRQELAGVLSTSTLKASQYQRVVAALSMLARYRPLVAAHLASAPAAKGSRGTAGADPALAKEVEEVFQQFARPGGSQDLSPRTTVSAGEAGADADALETSVPHTHIDAEGRVYAMGRRKESSARVWLVPAAQAKGAASGEGQIGQVLVNNAPLGQYFSRDAHRAAVSWPLKLAGQLGTVNVFALVRGGGNSGQAGALAHALAKALVVAAQADILPGGKEEAERIRAVLARDGVLRRDPRMVERKKTGLLKSRKARTWVKR